MSKNIGLQLYTVRDHLAQDFVGTLEKVAQIGYKGLEFAGYGGLTAKELHAVVTDLGMQPVSSHLSIDLLKNTSETIEYALELGLSYVSCPWLPEELRKTADDYRAVGETLAQLGEEYASHGLTLCYHNHAFEFEQKSANGEFGLDILYSSTPAHALQAELDVYWVERAGQKATEYVAKYAGRCPLIHIKDMEDSESQAFAEVGSGTLPLLDIIEAGSKNGTKWFFVEQDVCKNDSLASITTSMAYLKGVGIA